MTDLQNRLRNALAERYDIEREVGRGGMATVFLAQDRRHHRPVALKVLHPELALSLGSERFLREIQIAARLQHPHIVPLYDSGQAGELLYYVMPFVEGESLRQRLARAPPLPLEEAVQIARAVASALDYAHRQQIVHRDIKPENVMLHEGEAVVTDFGIAKAVSAAVAGNLTQTGTAIGTPAYMSPEQAGGAADLDARSDIYSLGAMLYEMVGGTAPFTGPTVQAIIAKLFTEPAAPLREQRHDTPPWLDTAVMKALAKTPEGRFATAAQFAQALTWPGGTSTPPELRTGAGAAVRSIAVLPFVNMSNDAENEYFSDGIAEEIINALTRIQALRVASRTSSFAFKGKNEDIGEIGRKLKVATGLEGSVRKAGSRLRVTAQLVSVADGNNLWSERYDRQLEDVFEIQDEIAGNIVKALRVVLSEGEKKAIEKAAPTENVEAYEYYLRGRQFFHQFRRTGMQFARRMYERAIETDPRYALAYAGMADSCSFLYMYWDGSKANLEAADQGSRKALELGPDLAEAHASRGFALTLSRQYEEARREFETATRAPRRGRGRARAPCGSPGRPPRGSPCSRPSTCRGTSSYRPCRRRPAHNAGRSRSPARTCAGRTACRCGGTGGRTAVRGDSTRTPRRSRWARPSRSPSSPPRSAPRGAPSRCCRRFRPGSRRRPPAGGRSAPTRGCCRRPRSPAAP